MPPFVAIAILVVQLASAQPAPSVRLSDGVLMPLLSFGLQVPSPAWIAGGLPLLGLITGLR